MSNLEELTNNLQGETKEAMLELVSSLADKIRENDRLSQTIDYLKHDIKVLRKKIFGSSSEKMKDPMVQDNFFNDFELCSQDIEVEELDALENEAPPNPSPRKKSGRKPLPKTLPRKVIEHDLSDEEKSCSCCGNDMDCIGNKVSEELEYQPAKFTVIENRRKQYTCKSCNQESHNAPAVIKIAKKPKKLIPKSIATPSLLAAIIVAKFADHLPLYRLERIFQRESIHLPRQTMSQWSIKVSKAVIPLVNLLQENILSYDVAFADETTLQVLKEPGRKAQTKSYIWCFVGGPVGRRSIIYQYHQRRKAEAAEEFFEDYQGAIHCDGYSGYNQLISSKQITGINCMAHVRRKFMEALPNGKEKGVSGRVVKLIRVLYKIESALKVANASPDTIKKIRLDKSKPLLDRLKKYLDEKKRVVPKNSPVGKAINYTLKRWDYFITYLNDGRFEIDNSRSERAIKPFVMGRKAWLFANTPLGAHSSARLYTLIESAKANRVEPRAYLEYIFKELPSCEFVEDYEALLPWRLTDRLPEYNIEHP